MRRLRSGDLLDRGDAAMRDRALDRDREELLPDAPCWPPARATVRTRAAKAPGAGAERRGWSARIAPIWKRPSARNDLRRAAAAFLQPPGSGDNVHESWWFAPAVRPVAPVAGEVDRHMGCNRDLP
jgi:hypothetical protein